MSETTPDRRGLDLIKCHFVSKEAGSSFGDDASSIDMQLNIFNKMMTPEVKLEKLTAANIQAWLYGNFMLDGNNIRRKRGRPFGSKNIRPLPAVPNKVLRRASGRRTNNVSISYNPAITANNDDSTVTGEQSDITMISLNSRQDSPKQELEHSSPDNRAANADELKHECKSVTQSPMANHSIRSSNLNGDEQPKRSKKKRKRVIIGMKRTKRRRLQEMSVSSQDNSDEVSMSDDTQLIEFEAKFDCVITDSLSSPTITDNTSPMLRKQCELQTNVLPCIQQDDSIKVEAMENITVERNLSESKENISHEKNDISKPCDANETSCSDETHSVSKSNAETIIDESSTFNADDDQKIKQASPLADRMEDQLLLKSLEPTKMTSTLLKRSNNNVAMSTKSPKAKRSSPKIATRTGNKKKAFGTMFKFLKEYRHLHAKLVTTYSKQRSPQKSNNHQFQVNKKSKETTSPQITNHNILHLSNHNSLSLTDNIPDNKVDEEVSKKKNNLIHSDDKTVQNESEIGVVENCSSEKNDGTHQMQSLCNNVVKDCSLPGHSCDTRVIPPKCMKSTECLQSQTALASEKPLNPRKPAIEVAMELLKSEKSSTVCNTASNQSMRTTTPFSAGSDTISKALRVARKKIGTDSTLQYKQIDDQENRIDIPPFHGDIKPRLDTSKPIFDITSSRSLIGNDTKMTMDDLLDLLDSNALPDISDTSVPTNISPQMSDIQYDTKVIMDSMLNRLELSMINHKCRSDPHESLARARISSGTELLYASPSKVESKTGMNGTDQGAVCRPCHTIAFNSTEEPSPKVADVFYSKRTSICEVTASNRSSKDEQFIDESSNNDSITSEKSAESVCETDVDAVVRSVLDKICDVVCNARLIHRKKKQNKDGTPKSVNEKTINSTHNQICESTPQGMDTRDIDIDADSSDELHIALDEKDSTSKSTESHMDIKTKKNRSKRRKFKLTMPPKRRVSPKQHEPKRPRVLLKIRMSDSSNSDINESYSSEILTHSSSQRKEKKSIHSRQANKRQKPYPRRESIFYLSDHPESAHVDPKLMYNKKHKKKKPKEVTDVDSKLIRPAAPNQMDSEGRLSIEFRNHNWFLEKYKTTLLNEPDGGPVFTVDDSSLPPKKRKFKRKKAPDEYIEPESEKKKQRSVKKKRNPKNQADLADNTRLQNSFPSDINISEEHVDESVFFSSNQLSETNDEFVTDLNSSRDGAELRILEVVSLAGFVKSDETTSEEQGRNSVIFESQRSKNITLPDVVPPPMSTEVTTGPSLDIQIKKKTSITEETPLDLSMKSSNFIALDLTVRTGKDSQCQISSALPSRTEIASSVYACFNIPGSSADNTKSRPLNTLTESRQHKHDASMHNGVSFPNCSSSANKIIDPVAFNRGPPPLYNSSISNSPVDRKADSKLRPLSRDLTLTDGPPSRHSSSNRPSSLSSSDVSSPPTRPLSSNSLSRPPSAYSLSRTPSVHDLIRPSAVLNTSRPPSNQSLPPSPFSDKSRSEKYNVDNILRSSRSPTPTNDRNIHRPYSDVSVPGLHNSSAIQLDNTFPKYPTEFGPPRESVRMSPSHTWLPPNSSVHNSMFTQHLPESHIPGSDFSNVKHLASSIPLPAATIKPRTAVTNRSILPHLNNSSSKSVEPSPKYHGSPSSSRQATEMRQNVSKSTSVTIHPFAELSQGSTAGTGRHPSDKSKQQQMTVSQILTADDAFRQHQNRSSHPCNDLFKPTSNTFNMSGRQEFAARPMPHTIDQLPYPRHLPSNVQGNAASYPRNDKPENRNITGMHDRFPGEHPIIRPTDGNTHSGLEMLNPMRPSSRGASFLAEDHSQSMTVQTARGSVRLPMAQMFCDKCNQKANFLCSGCKRVAYCSQNCQVSAWQGHKSRCSR